ncbi:type III pantothenate kinase [Spiroplasma gladiatoris]|uniref:Type III pantothenate kinase n=1 Tax=Spiroplasma gladiatoris TaxID=2143 RepID=A0A4P7AJU4_9MOLU|nr:type III pantothenate kinase [Spiroplasma gladiatoris]QBQ08098.1 type III pantothenate kinase [Spiroplasma gladiatoris]
MSILLIDIGNSTVDFRIFDDKKKNIIKVFRPSTNDKSYKSSSKLKKKLEELNQNISSIVYCSVVPEWNDIIRALGSSLKIKVYNFRENLVIQKEDFDLNGVENIGADFLANFIAVKNQYNLKNGLVISMGTASTIFLVQNYKFVGVSISPGLETSLKGLFNNASLLKDFLFHKTNAKIGQSTNDAINLGSCNGHFFMIMGLIDHFKKHFIIKSVIFTGGIANIFKEDIKNLDYVFDEQLIFKGILEIYKNIKREN